MTLVMVMNLGFAWGQGGVVTSTTPQYITIGISIAVRCLVCAVALGAFCA